MSLERDITAIKTLLEATPVFKAAGPEDMDRRAGVTRAAEDKARQERIAIAGPQLRKLMELARLARAADDEYIRASENDFIGNYGKQNDEQHPIKVSFSIKVYNWRMPEGVEDKLRDAGYLDSAYETTNEDMAGALTDFVEDLQAKYKFINGWSQEGRSGGWLVLDIDDVDNSYDASRLTGDFESMEYALDETEGWLPQDFKYAEQTFIDYRKALATRLHCLTAIEASIEKGKRDLEKWFSSTDYWDSYFERNEIADKRSEV